MSAEPIVNNSEPGWRDSTDALSTFNDADGRTQDEVLQVLDITITRVRAAHGYCLHLPDR